MSTYTNICNATNPSTYPTPKSTNKFYINHMCTLYYNIYFLWRGVGVLIHRIFKIQDIRKLFHA